MFSDFQWYDALRLVTIVLSIASMYRMGQRAIRLWPRYTTRLKDLWWAMNAMLLLVIEGSIEQIILNIGWGARVLLAFFVSVVCFRAVLRDEGYLKKP